MVQRGVCSVFPAKDRIYSLHLSGADSDFDMYVTMIEQRTDWRCGPPLSFFMKTQSAMMKKTGEEHMMRRRLSKKCRDWCSMEAVQIFKRRSFFGERNRNRVNFIRKNFYTHNRSFCLGGVMLYCCFLVFCNIM